MEVLDCSAEPVREGSTLLPRVPSKADDLQPRRAGALGVGSAVEAVSAPLDWMRESSAWRKSSRAVASCRTAGPWSVLREATMDPGALERTASASAPELKASG